MLENDLTIPSRPASRGETSHLEDLGLRPRLGCRFRVVRWAFLGRCAGSTECSGVRHPSRVRAVHSRRGHFGAATRGERGIRKALRKVRARQVTRAFSCPAVCPSVLGSSSCYTFSQVVVPCCKESEGLFLRLAIREHTVNYGCCLLGVEVAREGQTSYHENMFSLCASVPPPTYSPTLQVTIGRPIFGRVQRVTCN